MIQRLFCIALVLSGVAVAADAQDAAQADFATTVKSTHPVAYYRLDAAQGKSEAGVTTYALKGGATAAQGDVPTGAASYAKLDGKSGWVLTTQKGGVGTTASIMAWVNLAELPSKAGRIFYVAGESQSGNDLDLQIETDDVLRFFTAGGGRLEYRPAAASLLNKWHMVVATLDTVSKARAIYWDGNPVAKDMGGGTADKMAAFSAGDSTVFSGRWLQGGMAEIALWNRVLKASDVAAMYAAAGGPASGATGAGAGAGAGSGAGAGGGVGGMTSSAKVEAGDANGPIQLKREEQIALMVLSDIEVIERSCQLSAQKACSMSEAMTPAAGHEHLKLDPNKNDSNYTYTLVSGGTAWEAHANAKKPGLKGFCFMSRSVGTTVTTYSATGKAGWVDTEIGSRGVEGETFRAQ